MTDQTPRQQIAALWTAHVAADIAWKAAPCGPQKARLEAAADAALDRLLVAHRAMFPALRGKPVLEHIKQWLAEDHDTEQRGAA